MSEVPLQSCSTAKEYTISLAHMRKGSTSFGACEVRYWRWLFGNKNTSLYTISIAVDF